MGKKLTEPGKVRTKRGFLFFSKMIEGEVRWLQYAVWKEVFDWDGIYEGWQWKPLEWVN